MRIRSVPLVGSDMHNDFKQNSKPTFPSHKIEAC